MPATPLPAAKLPSPGAEGVVYLIDLTEWADRAWHVTTPERTWESGRRCEVVKFCAHALVRLLNDFAPAYVCAAVDAPSPTWRHVLHPTYKVRHPVKGSDYLMQLQWTRELFALHQIPTVQILGFEAEDVIAALTAQARVLGLRVVIVGQHRTLWSLLRDPDVLIWHERLHQGLGPAAAVARFGVPPEKVLDALALIGSTEDGIPGVHGLGEKTAAELLAPEAFGSLEALLARAKEIPQPKRRETIEAEADDAQLSRALLRLAAEAPAMLDLGAMRLGGFDVAGLRALYQDLDLEAYANRVEPMRKAPVPPSLLRRAVGLREARRAALAARQHAERLSRMPMPPLPPPDALRAFWALSAARFLPRPAAAPVVPVATLTRLLRRRSKPEQLSLFPT